MNRVYLTISQPGRLEMLEGKFLIYLFRKYVFSISLPSGPMPSADYSPVVCGE